MRYLKLFEQLSTVSEEDIRDCIKKGGTIYVDFVQDYKEKLEEPVRPVSIEDGSVTVEIDNEYYQVDLEHVNKINIEK